MPLDNHSHVLSVPGYMGVKEAAIRWGLTRRGVTKLCSENRILGAIKLSGAWLIPIMTQKPKKSRRHEEISPVMTGEITIPQIKKGEG